MALAGACQLVTAQPAASPDDNSEVPDTDARPGDAQRAAARIPRCDRNTWDSEFPTEPDRPLMDLRTALHESQHAVVALAGGFRVLNVALVPEAVTLALPLGWFKVGWEWFPSDPRDPDQRAQVAGGLLSSP